MGYFRLFKRFKVFPGVSLNLSKSGPSISVGPKGLKATFGPKGIRKTVGIPGTGVYYTEQEKYQGKGEETPQPAQSSPLKWALYSILSVIVFVVVYALAK